MRITFKSICLESLKLNTIQNLKDYLYNGATITTISHEVQKALDGTVLPIVEKVSKTQYSMAH